MLELHMCDVCFFFSNYGVCEVTVSRDFLLRFFIIKKPPTGLLIHSIYKNDIEFPDIQVEISRRGVATAWETHLSVVGTY